MRVRAALSALAVGTLLLTGCTSATDKPAPTNAAASPTPSLSPTPEPSPTPTDGVQVHSDPALGLFFDDVPDLAGDEARVYDAVARYQRGFWETARTNEVSPYFELGMVSVELKDSMTRIATNNAAEDARIAGEFHVRISDVEVTTDSATAIVCDDFRQATFANNTGELTPAEAGQDVPRRKKLHLIRIEGAFWYLRDITSEGTC